MKILPLIYSQNTLNKNAQARYNRFETPQDTFTQTTMTSSPSFGNKEALAKLAQDVINNPNSMQKYTKYMTEAFLFLLGIAGGKELIKPDSDNNMEPENLMAENARLRLENEELRRMNSAFTQKETSAEQNDTSALSSQEKPADELPEQIIENTETPKVSKHRCVHVKFPKKNAGKLSEGQKQLKSIAEKLRLSKDDCAKLTAICKKSLEKNTYMIDGKKRITVSLL